MADELVTPQSSGLPGVEPSGEAVGPVNIQTNPDEFGAGWGKAVHDMGDTGEQIALRRQEILNETSANQGLNDYMKTAYGALTDFKEKQGQNAISAWPQMQQQLEDQFAASRAAMPNDAVRREFDASGMRILRSVYSAADDHQSSQWVKYQNDTADATIQNAINAVATNPWDTDLLHRSAANITKSVTEKGIVSGWGQEQMLQQENHWVSEAYIANAKTIAAGDANHPPDYDRAEKIINDAAAAGQIDANHLAQIDLFFRPQLRAMRLQGITDAFLAPLINNADPGSPPPSGTAAGFANNLGNIKSSPASWDLKGGAFNGFETFATPEAGVKALVGNFRSYGDIPLQDAIQKWQSSPGDNPRGTIAMLAAQGFDPKKPLPLGDPERMATVAETMARAEGKSSIPDRDVFLSGSRAAIEGTRLSMPSTGVARDGTVVTDPSSPGATAPDWNAWKNEAYRQYKGDPEAFRAVNAKLSLLKSEWTASTADTRWKLEHDPVESVEAKTAAALTGGYTGDIPEADIRAVFPAPKAQAMIENFRVAQQTGQELLSLKFASPDEARETFAEIAAGQGIKSLQERFRKNMPASGPGSVQPEAEEEDAGFQRMRTQALGYARQVISERFTALLDPKAGDPAAYVADHPAVKDALSKVEWDKKDPTTGEMPGFQAYASQTLAKQTYLGVPENQQHILQRGQAETLTRSIMNIPQGGDPHAALQDMEKQFGASWPKVFTDMVSLGGLPASYQAVSVLDNPHDAALLARGLVEVKPHPDGTPGKTWSDLIGSGPGGESQIKAAIRSNPSVTALTTSLLRGGASADQINDVFGAIDTLAFSKKLYENDPDPSGSAIKAFTDRYEYMPNGGAHVPAKIFDQVTAAAQQKVDGLDLNQIQVPEIYGQLGFPKQEEYLTWLKQNPVWVTVGDKLQLLDRGNRFVRMKDGSPLTVPFSAVANQKTASQDNFELSGP